MGLQVTTTEGEGEAVETNEGAGGYTCEQVEPGHWSVGYDFCGDVSCVNGRMENMKANEILVSSSFFKGKAE